MDETPQPPAQPPSLGQAVCWLTQLEGYLSRKGDGPPGTEVLWRGLQRLVDLSLMFQVFSPPQRRPKCG
jgi:hypothetical protein